MADLSPQLMRLMSRISRLSPMQVEEVERTVARLEVLAAQQRGEKESGDESPHSKDWPHAPLHRLSEKGTFMVTAGTLGKEHFFRDAKTLDLLEGQLLSKAKEYHWQLEAWAVFSNHYHFIAHAIEDAATLKLFLSHLHADTAREVNLLDGKSDRKVWFNFWDTELTYEKSYLARLNYVHQNAVKHALVPVANQYRWCSAAWFERTARPAQVKTIYSFQTDRIRVVDDFDVLGVR
ncbi:MAG: transposase [Pirellulaceae bacterium]